MIKNPGLVKSTGGSPMSLDAIKAKMALQKSSSENSGIAQSAATNTQSEPFSLEDLMKVWQEVPEVLEQANKSYGSVLAQTSKTRFISPNTLYVQVASATQADQFTEVIPLVYDHIKKRLRNDSVVIKTEIVESKQTEKKLYTSQDKFTYLAEKYPDLLKLRDKLGLDVDM